ncbi:hypothetical protein Avbf_01060 [Armadillidium vulgare]|nr:hypothetical protein Avbf_01060 [Armadillidium vulgare]
MVSNICLGPQILMRIMRLPQHTMDNMPLLIIIHIIYRLGTRGVIALLVPRQLPISTSDFNASPSGETEEGLEVEGLKLSQWIRALCVY